MNKIITIKIIPRRNKLGIILPKYEYIGIPIPAITMKIIGEKKLKLIYKRTISFCFSLNLKINHLNLIKR